MRLMFAIMPLVTMLVACSPSATTTFPLGEKATFAVTDGEELAHPSKKTDVDRYAALLNAYDTLQIPLYRHVRSTSYDIYVGFAIAADNIDPVATVAADTTARILARKDEGGAVSILMSKHDNTISVSFPHALKDPRIVVAMVSKDQQKVREWFNGNESLKRIDTD